MSSRRPANPAAERAAKNQATIKSLLKLEANKVCSDCKRNKHPRWASWNLGVFICIRCSGIHRGMGTHISRVKSVDLDSWTDEQLQSILSWGNARANKFWEAKLAQGHVPSESKIENFIRTKYELKRWAMDGPIPDPATLDVDEDDNVPLSVVKEKQNVERRESVRKTGSPPQPRSAGPSAPQIDLMGGDDIPPRASTTGPPPVSHVPPKAAPAAPKATNAKDSLLGLDFLGDAPAAPSRPASTASVGGGAAQSRPDLKQSILSLYASAPKPQPQQPTHGASGSMSGFGGMQSPTMGHQPKPSGGAGLNDAFAGLSFGGVSSPKSPPQKDAFAGLTSMSAKSPPPQQQSAFSNLSSGGFFDAKPAQPAPPQQNAQSSSGWGSFSSPAPAPAVTPAPKPAQSSSSGFGDLLDWSAPAPQLAPAAPKPAPAPAPAASSSVFNLSTNPPKPAPAPAATATNPVASVNASALSGADVWGNAWGEPEASAPPPKPAQTSTNPLGGLGGGGGGGAGGWGASSGSATGGSFANQSIVPGASGGFAATGGSFANQSLVPGSSGGFTAAPKVAADEEFGGWASSTGTGATKSGGGFAGSEDLFSNVWE